jgi:hypothetical protein
VWVASRSVPVAVGGQPQASASDVIVNCPPVRWTTTTDEILKNAQPPEDPGTVQQMIRDLLGGYVGLELFEQQRSMFDGGVPGLDLFLCVVFTVRPV